jgi:hypothetical protein
MPLRDTLIAQQNPWWRGGRDWEASDPHLRRLAAQPVSLPSSIGEVVRLDAPGIHTLRGPRQVGKSTDLKILVRSALARGVAARDIVYVSFEPLIGQPVAEAVATVTRAKDLAGSAGAAVVLLDEVTAVRDWQAAVMHLYEVGVIDRDVVVCTGSSSVDLRRGTHERLPGRRGAGADHLVAPRGFADFALAVDHDLPAPPRLALADLASAEADDALNDLRIFEGALERCMRLYCRFGGLPAAVAEAASGAPEPGASTRRVLVDSLLGEVRRKGASETATEALLERMVRSLGSKVSWAALARDMDVPLGPLSRGPATRGGVRDYVEFLADAYFVLVVYFWKHDSDSAEQSRDKKLYFGDPLLHTIALGMAPGLSADTPALVENLVALALYRHSEPLAQQVDSQRNPHRLHVYGTRAGGEIDFVAGPRAEAVPVEVKYQATPDLRKATGIVRAFPGRRALIVTRDLLFGRPRYALVPAPMFLWALDPTSPAG